MGNRLMQNVVLPSTSKSSENVRIKVLVGPLAGKEYTAQKIKGDVNTYSIEQTGIKTYLAEQDVVLV